MLPATVTRLDHETQSEICHALQQFLFPCLGIVNVPVAGLVFEFLAATPILRVLRSVTWPINRKALVDSALYLGSCTVQEVMIRCGPLLKHRKPREPEAEADRSRAILKLLKHAWQSWRPR